MDDLMRAAPILVLIVTFVVACVITGRAYEREKLGHGKRILHRGHRRQSQQTDRLT
jgi:hypothetical protein